MIMWIIEFVRSLNMDRSIALNYFMSILKSIAESRTVTELVRILCHEFGDQYCIAYLIYWFLCFLCLAAR